MKKAHKKSKAKQKAEIKNKTMASSQDLKECSESALAKCPFPYLNLN